ncbi:hypothetical protein OIU79_015988 [Salix purpurea]|uniref:Uncharacterized protein n=1 Tax=Salix purpurea TaxID=77065 RepID=A0A9Q0PDC6_SALPP|nr:hypothetical protein OIU79_015988 [Salix purpurea]
MMRKMRGFKGWKTVCPDLNLDLQSDGDPPTWWQRFRPIRNSMQVEVKALIENHQLGPSFKKGS